MRGWTPADMIVLAFIVGLTLACMFSPGCYDAHTAEPCDADGGEDSLSVIKLSPAERSGKRIPDVFYDSGVVECAGPIVAGECYADLEDWLTQ